MKKKRALTYILASMILVGMLSVLTLAAPDQENVRFTRKVVSVLYDNSGSMNETGSADPSKDTPNTPMKNDYALYAIQMLMSLLGEEDSLIISPMNNYTPVEIDLSKEDRNHEIDNIISSQSSFFSKTPYGGTPYKSIKTAIDELVARGLKEKSELAFEDSNTEYWSIIFTDGQFANTVNGRSVSIDAEKAIEEFIAPYPSLHTIYLGFVDAVDLNNSKLSDSYKFSSYLAKDPSSIINVMQDIANQLSGRYTLPSSNYEISGNKITIDLDAFEYSFKNISVIAQNCDASLVSATYNGSPISPTQECFFNPKKLENVGMKSGYSAVFKGDPYLFGGKIELTFDKDIADVSILAEPALDIEHYFEYFDGNKYTEVDMQFINSTLTDKDKIRVGYRVKEKANNKHINLEKLFGKAETKVNYAGKSYVCGDDIPLALGMNEIAISVSVMDGKYTMYSSELCIVESDPFNYRIDDGKCPDTITSPNGSDATVQVVYDVYVSGNKLTTKAEVEQYKLEHSFTDQDGNPIESSLIINNNGTITTNAKISFGKFGEYTEFIKITSSDGISREHTHTTSYAPSVITVNTIENETLSMSEHQLSNNDKTVKFELLTDGAPLNFDSSLITYILTIDGVDVTPYVSLESNTLSYTPKSSTVSSMPIRQGKVEINLEVYLNGNKKVKDTSSAFIEVSPSSYVFESVPSPEKEIDRFALDDNTAVLYFKLLRDNVPLPQNELKNLFDAGLIKVKDTGTFSKYFWLPVGMSATVESYEDTGVVSVRVTRDFAKPFHSFAAMLLLNGNKNITVSYENTSASDFFIFPPSSVWSYIWRILVILLIIHIILFIIGFFISKSFPTGTFLKIRLPDDDNSKVTVASYGVNLSFKDKWLWHWRRFFFFLPIWGNQPEENVMSLVKIKFVKGKEKAQLDFIKNNMRTLDYSRTNNLPGRAYQDYLKEIQNHKYKGTPIRMKDAVTSGALRRMFRGRDNGAKVKLQTCNLSSTPFGLYDSNFKLKEILLFVRRNKK